MLQAPLQSSVAAHAVQRWQLLRQIMSQGMRRPLAVALTLISCGAGLADYVVQQEDEADSRGLQLARDIAQVRGCHAVCPLYPAV